MNKVSFYQTHHGSLLAHIEGKCYILIDSKQHGLVIDHKLEATDKKIHQITDPVSTEFITELYLAAWSSWT